MAGKVFTSKVIAYKKDDRFIAVALNFDLVVEGETMGQAIDYLDESVIGYLKMCLEDGESNAEIYRDAPQKYFKMYDLFLELEEQDKVKYGKQYLGMAKFDKKELVNVS